MITFTIALVVLVLGYVLYGKYLARLLDINPQNVTPAVSKADGVDYVPMPTWKIFMIQFLNIAGLGPIFGAIMGAKFGTSSYLWIVLGTIFAGAMHDFVSAMISVRSGGQSLPHWLLPRKYHSEDNGGVLHNTHGACRRHLHLAACRHP